MKRKFKIIFSFVLALCMLASPIWSKAAGYNGRNVMNSEEIRAVSTDTLKEDQTGRILNETCYEFDKTMKGKFIKIVAEADGSLCVIPSIDWNISLLDSDKKDIKGQKRAERDDGIYIKNVKRGDIFYVKIPTDYARVSLNAHIYPDNVSKIVKNKTYIQSGQNKYTYKYFEVSKRSKVEITVSPLFIDYKTHSYMYLQRKESGAWKNVTARQKGEADEHGRGYFVGGLKKGQYRIAVKTKENQLTEIRMDWNTNISKYQTKKSKAQKVKLKTTKTNIYTPTEKASRWYRIYRKTAKYKRYVIVRTENNSGKIKVAIYKKGRKKPIKTSVISSDGYDPYKMTGKKKFTYRLKSGKGTYYVKVSKSGSKMNGQYSIQYK